MKLNIYQIIAIVSIIIMASLNSFAYDFESNGIYYNIISEQTPSVEVTYNTYSNTYSGSVSIPDKVIYDSITFNVTTIGKGAFYNCDSLTEITIPNSIRKIREYAFYGCISLTEITIPHSVNIIEYDAFRMCKSLTEIVLPYSVQSIKATSFWECFNLKQIIVDKLNKYFCSIDGILFNKSASKLIICPPGREEPVIIPDSVTEIDTGAFCGCLFIKSVSIPDSVTDIGNQAFYGCSSISEIIIPDSVARIKNMTFMGCTNLNSVIIPPSVKIIESSAFCMCSSLSEISIPDSITDIGNEAFYMCSSLNEITIPMSVTQIGCGAFAKCNNLKNITVDSSNQYFCSVDGILYNNDVSALICCPGGKEDVLILPESVNHIIDYACMGCSFLKSIILQDYVTYIGISAFSLCSNMNKFIIPDSVTDICSGAFAGCSSLTDITIPISINSIGDYAFEGCDNITTIFCKPTTPPAYFGQFGENGFTEATLYVPTGCRGAYESANPWWYFKNIMEMDFSGVVDSFADEKTEISFSIENGYLTINGVPGKETICVYKMDGELIYSGTQNVIPDLIRGIYIVKVGNTMAKVAI